MDISTLTDAELKALGFDQMEILNQAQANLAIIRAEVERRRLAEIKRLADDNDQ